MVQVLLTIPGCGEISAWTIRAYTDDIGRYGSSKKYASYAGLVPWVQGSNEVVRYGKITKRGPEELRTALVQVVMGMLRLKKTTVGWRLIKRYEEMKRNKGSGKSITASARKVAVMIWHMLSEDKEFEEGLMSDEKTMKQVEPKKSTASILAEKASSIDENLKTVCAKPRGAKSKEPVLPERKKKKAG